MTQARHGTSQTFSLIALRPFPATQIGIEQTRTNYLHYRAEWGTEDAQRKLRQDLADWVHAATGDLSDEEEQEQVRLAWQAVMVGIDEAA